MKLAATFSAIRTKHVLVLLALVLGCDDDLYEDVDACAYRTLQQAIDCAPAGSRVSICGGVHEEAISITKPLTVFGSAAKTTVLTGGGAELIVSIHARAGAVSVHSLVLKPNRAAPASRAALIVLDSQAVRLTDLTVDLAEIRGTVVDAEGGFGALAGIEVDNSLVTLSDSEVHNVGNEHHVGNGLLIRATSDVAVSSTALRALSGSGIEISDSAVSITDTTIDDATSGLVMDSGDVHVVDAVIASARNDGIVVQGGVLHGARATVTDPQRYGVLSADGLVDLEDAQIVNATDGVHVTLGTALVTGRVENARESALYVGDEGLVAFGPGTVSRAQRGVLVNYPSGQVVLTSASVESASGVGIELRAGELTMMGGAVTASARQGILASGGSLSVVGASIEGSGADAVLLTGMTTAVLADVTISNNAGWGVVCDGGAPAGNSSSVALQGCAGHFSDNANGVAHLVNGCETLFMCLALEP